MAVAAVGVVGASLAASAGPAGIGIGATLALTAASALGAYADNMWIYPALFGKDDPKPQDLEGFQLSTTDPGAARWEVYGARAWVPCHYLWNRNVNQSSEGGGGDGKGGGNRQRFNVLRADVGIGVCDGPIFEIDTIYADEQLMWTQQFSRAFIEDSRWNVAIGNSTKQIIVAPNRRAVDFTSIFEVGDTAQLAGMLPSSIDGYYTVSFVNPHTVGNPSFIEFDPLEGQVPTAGVSGTPLEPGLARRIDSGYSEPVAHFEIQLAGAYLVIGYNVGISNLPLASQFQPGEIYEFISFGANAVGNEGLGLWRMKKHINTAVAPDPAFPGITVAPYFEFERVNAEPFVSTQGALLSGASSALTPFVFIRTELGGFKNYDEDQSFAVYNGTLTQTPDPTLASSEPDAGAHRGLAHVSVSDWNLGPHGNIFPRITALARAGRGETVGTALKRICARTMDDDQSDVTAVGYRPLHGYSIPGGSPTLQALQPLQSYYGIITQDRGGVLTFMDEQDLPIVPVATRHLNALPANQQRVGKGVILDKIDESDIPQRVVVHYVSQQDGSNEARGAGTRSPNSEDRSKRDTLDVRVRPLVAPEYEAKQRARELLRRMKLETVSGSTVLPPSYMDVMPAHCITFQSNNEQVENVAPGSTISHTTEVRDILSGSVSLEVAFSDGQVANLRDDGAGALAGYPDSITTITTSTVDYVNGVITVDTTPALDSDFVPVLRYEYEKQMLMRIREANSSAYDLSTQVSLVQTTTDEPLPSIGGANTPGLTPLPGGETEPPTIGVVDMPAMFVGQSGRVLIGIAAQQAPGASWLGASVYESPNGTDSWTFVGAPADQSEMGTAPDPLPTGQDPGIVDWSNQFVIVMEGPNFSPTTQTLEGIASGNNLLMVGDELIGYHEALNAGGDVWVLSGLMRGMRGTISKMETHTSSEAVVDMTGMGSAHGLVYEPTGGFAGANKTYYHRVVPSGTSLSTAETITTFIRGRAAAPAQPIFYDELVSVTVGTGLNIKWGRRSLNQSTVFGAAPLQPGEFERYEVRAYHVAEAAALVSGGETEDNARLLATKRVFDVGDESMLTPLVVKDLDYRNTDITSDFTAGGSSWTLGVDPVGLVVLQIGAAGASDQSAVVVVTPS